jgi:hypothetical protein
MIERDTPARGTGMLLRALVLVLTLSAGIARCDDPIPDKTRTETFGLYYSGPRLDTLRDKFKNTKFESEKLKDVFSDVDSQFGKYETVILDVTKDKSDSKVLGIKVSATLVNQFPPKVKKIDDVKADEPDFVKIMELFRRDIDAAAKDKK